MTYSSHRIFSPKTYTGLIRPLNLKRIFGLFQLSELGMFLVQSLGYLSFTAFATANARAYKSRFSVCCLPLHCLEFFGCAGGLGHGGGPGG